MVAVTMAHSWAIGLPWLCLASLVWLGLSSDESEPGWPKAVSMKVKGWAGQAWLIEVRGLGAKLARHRPTTGRHKGPCLQPRSTHSQWNDVEAEACQGHRFRLQASCRCKNT